jgi:hypothetical protein
LRIPLFPENGTVLRGHEGRDHGEELRNGQDVEHFGEAFGYDEVVKCARRRAT